MELHGTEGTAKSEMLYHLIVRCILPTKHGGLETEVMFVDTDYHFDTLRLVTILEARLAQQSAEPTRESCPKEGTEEEEGDEEMVKACLQRLFLVHSSTSAQMLLSLHYLEGWFSSRPTLGLLVLDSISAFYWQDRCNGGGSVPRQEANLRKCTQLLERLRKDYGIVVFATVHAIMRNYGNSSETSSNTAPRPREAPSPSTSSSASSSSWRRSNVVDFDKPYICPVWRRLVTQRLVFSKSDVSKDKSPVFSVACTTTRTRGVKRSSFCITDGGMQFL